MFPPELVSGPVAFLHHRPFSMHHSLPPRRGYNKALHCRVAGYIPLANYHTDHFLPAFDDLIHFN